MRGGNTSVAGRFEHGGAEAAHQAALLHGQDERGFLKGLADRSPVKRLDEPGIDHADPQAVKLAKLLGGPHAGPQHCTAGQDHAVGLPLENSAWPSSMGWGSRSTVSRLARG